MRSLIIKYNALPCVYIERDRNRERERDTEIDIGFNLSCLMDCFAKFIDS